MKKISSKNNEVIKELASLTTKKKIKEKGLYLVEGRNLIIEALEAKLVEKILITDESMYANYLEVEKILVNEEIIKKLSSNITNKGSIAICKYEPLSINLDGVKKIIVLENINNPGNLGTITRTALAFGYEAVITIGESVFAYNDKVLKSSQGAVFKIPVIQMKDFNLLKSFIPLRFVLDNNSKFLEEIDIPLEKFALVFGNEANGITNKLLNEWKGTNVKIDIKSIESLNLAIAAGIAMYRFK